MLFVGTAVAILFALAFTWKFSVPFRFKSPENHVSPVKLIDYTGVVVSVVASVLLRLGLELGGTAGFAWSSGPILGYLICGIILLIAFFIYEYLYADKFFKAFNGQHTTDKNISYAIMNPALFSKRNVFIVFVSCVIYEVGTAASAYEQSFFQTVSGVSASISGYINYAVSIGAIVFSAGVSRILAC
ncbi:hypothetical protein HK100_012741, partial [Physocladia obscura]